MLRPEQVVLRPAEGAVNGSEVLAQVVAADFAGASTTLELRTAPCSRT
jgi:hypothetical protein